MSDQPAQPQHRRIGSLLAKRSPVPAQTPSASPPDPIAEAMKAQAASMESLAQAIRSQPAADVKVEMQPAPPRRYLITVGERDSDKLPKSYLVEPLAKA